MSCNFKTEIGLFIAYLLKIREDASAKRRESGGASSSLAGGGVVFLLPVAGEKSVNLLSVLGPKATKVIGH
jgi:hypothetical protein